jgi:hypothetical protein
MLVVDVIIRVFFFMVMLFACCHQSKELKACWNKLWMIAIFTLILYFITIISRIVSFMLLFQVCTHEIQQAYWYFAIMQLLFDVATIPSLAFVGLFAIRDKIPEACLKDKCL